jgi:cytochrome c oxidase cbb3-type subunit 2
MLNLGKNHKLLVFIIFAAFTLLSVLVAVAPAITMQQNNSPLPGTESLSIEEQRGLRIYIREGCVSCHTQQVRNIEMDHVWGERPSIPSDYFHSKQRLDVWRQTPSILGSERTGPDLTSIAQRNPSDTWHLMHLFNPRIVVPESIMPGYPWLFEKKREAGIDDVVVNVPPTLISPGEVVVATQNAKDLVAYLLTLKQTKLPTGPETFLRLNKKTTAKSTSPVTKDSPSEKNELADGATLYQSNCAACHQPSGEGLPGAFPSLKGSGIVTNENPETLIRIIIEGYDARPEFATMPSLGDQLTDDEITAIINFERSHWGNDAPPIEVDVVKKVRASKQNQ